MKRHCTTLLFACLLTLIATAQEQKYTQQEVVYDRKDGMALMMTVLTPAKPNGKAVISLNSGGWGSSYDWQESFITRALPFVNRGYTVFITSHGAAPKYAIDDAVFDIKRAVQFVRYKASTFGIDSLHIGITGTSSGGHLALMAGMADDVRNSASNDPIERMSSKVQAVAVFCPPTDFLNYGRLEFNLAAQTVLLQQHRVLGAFQFKQWDKAQRVYVPVTDKAQLLEVAKSVSPAQLVTADDAPTYIMHGDKDNEVPLQQSQWMEQKLKAAKVPVVLTVKPGAGHGWKGMEEDEKAFVQWFDQHLGVKR
ncbi:alpha/beta hydrolase [Paraflavitalea pollutisoli]|uniref:alpha/beta hydrolase n=1 Tax=Paraflavitalea pollutisoli TaxID=3034143 RepID=UPI0023ED9344|nr:alpha/beta hydrolase [Paraflavitalea sp. H1-2-19X]